MEDAAEQTAGNTNLNETRDVLDRVHNAAAALVAAIAPMLEHPETNTSVADDAALLLDLANDQWDPLEIERIAERAAGFSASAMEALNKIGREKDVGYHANTEIRALVFYLRGIEYKYTGKNSGWYTFDPECRPSIGGRTQGASRSCTAVPQTSNKTQTKKSQFCYLASEGLSLHYDASQRLMWSKANEYRWLHSRGAASRRRDRRR